MKNTGEHLDTEERHERVMEQQEALPTERTGARGTDKPAATRDSDKAERMDEERDDEQEEGITRARRGSRAAPSDRPENEPPHPQDVNEIGEARG